jgi:hypothetical protein
MGPLVFFALVLAIGLGACGKRELIPLEQQHRSSSGQDGDMLASWAQGQDITKSFLQSYAGKFSDKSSKLPALRVDEDGTYEMVSGGQVGSRGSTSLPYPTVCWLKTAGSIKRVVERSEESRQGYLPYASHVLLLMETSAQLLDPKESGVAHDPNCDRLARPEWGREASRHLFVELLDHDSLRLHRKGSDHGSASRSGGTLDEVYTRDQ